MGKHINPRPGVRCERCGRTISSQQVSHFIACGMVPKPKDLAAIYRATTTVSVTDLATQYKVSPAFIRQHLLDAGVTLEEIQSRRHSFGTAKRVWTDKPTSAVRCAVCEILIYKVNPPNECQQNCGGLCPECAGMGVKRVTEFDGLMAYGV